MASKIIFVYAGDPDNTDNISPYTITRNVHRALSKLGEVVYYDWCHCGPFQPVATDDIVIGHPNYPESTALRQLFKNKCRAKILMFPFHHGMPEINWPFDDLVRQADAYLCITGPYWYDTAQDTMFAHWKSKMVRLDMAIDQEHFPLVKTSYNDPGKRSFFYIGADRPEKGLSTLRDIFQGTNHVLHLYGMIDGANAICRLPNVKLHGFTPVTPQFARGLARIADCHLHGGISDANPTTLLETTCWGFVAGCTPQSGYWPDQPFYGLNRNDIEGCRSLLNYVQSVPSDVLLKRAESNRLFVAHRHTWDVFTSKVVDVVKRFL